MKVVPVTNSPSRPNKGGESAKDDSDDSSSLFSEKSDDEMDVTTFSTKSVSKSRESRNPVASKLMKKNNEIKAKVVKEVLDQVLPDIGAYDIDGTTKQRKQSETAASLVRWLKFFGCLELDVHDAVLTGSIQRVQGSLRKLQEAGKGELVNQYDENGYTPLSLAVKINDLEIVEALLHAGALPDILDEGSGRSPLLFSVQLGSSTISELLLNHGASVNMPDFKCITPLMIATSLNDLPMCQLLCSRLEVELDIQDENGWSALHYGSMTNAVECVKFLIAEGADKRLRDVNQRKALHLAKFKQHGECVAVLSSAASKVLF